MRKSKDFPQIGRRPKNWAVNQITDEKGETIRIYTKKSALRDIKLIQHKGEVMDFTKAL